MAYKLSESQQQEILTLAANFRGGPIADARTRLKLVTNEAARQVHQIELDRSDETAKNFKSNALQNNYPTKEGYENALQYLKVVGPEKIALIRKKIEADIIDPTGKGAMEVHKAVLSAEEAQAKASEWLTDPGKTIAAAKDTALDVLEQGGQALLKVQTTALKSMWPILAIGAIGVGIYLFGPTIRRKMARGQEGI